LPELYWYPSIGNKGYPFTRWESKYREYAWETLLIIGETYHSICRLFRKKYKWDPIMVDSLTLQRIWRIYEEIIEDKEESSEDDFE